MGIHIDTSELEKLAVDLNEAPGRIQRSAPRIVTAGARAIERRMTEDFSGHRNLAQLGSKVASERLDGLGLWWEIGINKGGQGDLGNIAAYGTSNNAPVADKNAGLIVEAPKVIEQLGGAGEDAVLGGAE